MLDFVILRSLSIMLPYMNANHAQKKSLISITKNNYVVLAPRKSHFLMQMKLDARNVQRTHQFLTLPFRHARRVPTISHILIFAPDNVQIAQRKSHSLIRKHINVLLAMKIKNSTK